MRKRGFTQDGKIRCMKKKDEKGKMEEMHQHKVAKMIESAEGSAGLLHKISKPTAWRGRGADLGK